MIEQITKKINDINQEIALKGLRVVLPNGQQMDSAWCAPISPNPATRNPQMKALSHYVMSWFELCIYVSSRNLSILTTIQI